MCAGRTGCTATLCSAASSSPHSAANAPGRGPTDPLVRLALLHRPHPARLHTPRASRATPYRGGVCKPPATMCLPSSSPSTMVAASSHAGAFSAAASSAAASAGRPHLLRCGENRAGNCHACACTGHGGADPAHRVSPQHLRAIVWRAWPTRPNMSPADRPRLRVVPRALPCNLGIAAPLGTGTANAVCDGRPCSSSSSWDSCARLHLPPVPAEAKRANITRAVHATPTPGQRLGGDDADDQSV